LHPESLITGRKTRKFGGSLIVPFFPLYKVYSSPNSLKLYRKSRYFCIGVSLCFRGYNMPLYSIIEPV
jgi:hypothetical protein